MLRRRIADRQEFLRRYGDACWCCGETDPKFLTIGHTNGDGAEVRRRLNASDSSKILSDLRRRGWPIDEGLATECFNCNLGAARNGGSCPHKA